MRRFYSLLLTALVLPCAVGAQGPPVSTDTTTPDTLPGDTVIPIAPIRVTVLRTPLRLSETPFAVTVERPEGAGPGLTLAEALGSVPGLQVDNRYNFSQGDRLSVRGLGARAQFGVRGLKVLVDGIPATLPDGQTSLSHVDPLRIEGAEVVRGPASSLWGNAAGGVVQLETGPPSGAASASVLAGAHGLVHWTGEAGWGGGSGASASGSDVAGWGASASASRLLYGGFRDHAAADKWFGSARAEWTGERDALRLVAHGVSYHARNPGSLSDSLLAVDRTQAYGFNVVQKTGEAAEQAQVGLTWTRSFGSGGGLEVTAWALTRELDNPIPPVIIDLGRVAAGVRASVRGALALAGRRVRWVTGVDAEGQWDDRQNFENEAGDRGALVLDQTEAVAAVAPFLEVETPVAGPVSALAGLRWDRHVFTADDRMRVAGDPSTDASGSRVMGQLSPSLGLVAELGRVSVYGSVASSFETPTTTELVNRPTGGQGFNPELQPQRALSVEAGARARIGPGRVHVAAYRMRIRDALIPFEVPTEPGRTFFRNAGSAVHRGLELDAWLALGAGFGARVGWTWVDARFDRFATADGDYAGNRVPGVAPHRVTGSLSWRGDGARLELAGRWVDAVPVTDANEARAPSYALLDLRGSSPPLQLGGTSLELFGGIDNLLDADYVASVVVNAFGGRYYEPGPGRAAYLGVRVR
jgi:iron complex outermembrane receptor protein